MLLFASVAYGEDARIDDIRAAVAELRGMDLVQAQAAVLSCYHEAKPYRTCVAQDFIVANVAARAAANPMPVLEQMADRVTAAMERNHVPLQDAQQFILLVKQHALAQ